MDGARCGLEKAVGPSHSVRQRDAPSLRNNNWRSASSTADPHLPIALGAAYEVLAQATGGKRAARPSGQPAALGFGALWKYLHSSAAPEEPQPAGSGRPTRAALTGNPVSRTKASNSGRAERFASSIYSSGRIGVWTAKPRSPSSPACARSSLPRAWSSSVQPNSTATQPKEPMRRPNRSARISNLSAPRYYASLQDMPVPLSRQNFNAYGASTTPTLVVLNRAGQVAMYHPGAISYDELRRAVQKAVAP